MQNSRNSKHKFRADTGQRGLRGQYRGIFQGSEGDKHFLDKLLSQNSNPFKKKLLVTVYLSQTNYICWKTRSQILSKTVILNCKVNQHLLSYWRMPSTRYIINLLHRYSRRNVFPPFGALSNRSNTRWESTDSKFNQNIRK